MNCRRVQRRISPYCDDRLSPGERARVAEHLEGCASCRGEHASFIRALDALTALNRVEPAPQGWERLRASLEAPRSPAPRIWPHSLPVSGRVLAGAVALLIIAAASAVVLQPGRDLRAPSALRPQPLAPAPAQGLALLPPPAAPAAPALAHAERPEAAPAVAPAPSPRPFRRYAYALSKGRLPVPNPARAAITEGLEPDPELASYSSAAGAESVTREVAQMVSTGLAPLVAAAEPEDPLQWITDVDAEEWL